MAGKWARIGFRLAFWLYAGGLICWLLLGLVAFAAEIPAVAHQFADLAAQPGVAGRLAGRVLHADMADLPGPAVVAVQYAFSLLNLVLGLMLVLRRPDDRVPRLLGFALLGTAATFNMPSHVVFHVLGSPWPIALAHFTFHIVSGVCYLWAVLLFPDGRLPRRIRLTGRPLAVVVTAVTVIIVLVCWRSSFLAHPQFFVIFFGVLVPVAGVSAATLRLTDPLATMADRRVSRLLVAALLPALAVALLWLLARAVGLAGGRLAVTASGWAVDLQNAFPAVFAIVPVVLVAGVIRYRLWDIDRLLSRVLTYAVIVLTATAVYVVLVAGAGSVAGAGWWTVFAVAVAAVLIEPVRVLAHRWANKVVYGRRLSPSEAIRTLIGGLGRLTPTGELDQLVGVAVAATRAQAAAIWVIDGDRLVLAAAAPAGAASATVALPDSEVPCWATELGMGTCVPLIHAGELLGVLGVRGGGDGTLGGRDAALIADIAAHAGLLVHNALLTVELARRVADLADRTEQLRVARRRLVLAQDAERRALERNLHDGAQQSLVAAIVGLRTLALTGTGSRSADATTEAYEWRAVLDSAGRDLADLCGAAEPRALRAGGLAGALAETAAILAKAGLRVDLDVDPRAELESPARTAVYFCVLEALQNAAKHARATRVRVRVWYRDGELAFEIDDDGVGFDVVADGRGGLSLLGGRLEPLGGRVVVDSAPGAGTRISGVVPSPGGVPVACPESVEA